MLLPELSPYLFSLVTDELTNEVQDEVRRCMTVDENIKVSEDKFDHFRRVLEKYRLKISRAKANFLELRLLK